MLFRRFGGTITREQALEQAPPLIHVRTPALGADANKATVATAEFVKAGEAGGC
ncbi:hypothetical protein GCM10028798_23070 [Humibacter antri]